MNHNMTQSNKTAVYSNVCRQQQAWNMEQAWNTAHEF